MIQCWAVIVLKNWGGKGERGDTAPFLSNYSRKNAVLCPHSSRKYLKTEFNIHLGGSKSAHSKHLHFSKKPAGMQAYSCPCFWCKPFSTITHQGGGYTKSPVWSLSPQAASCDLSPSPICCSEPAGASLQSCTLSLSAASLQTLHSY